VGLLVLSGTQEGTCLIWTHFPILALLRGGSLGSRLLLLLFLLPSRGGIGTLTIGVGGGSRGRRGLDSMPCLLLITGLLLTLLLLCILLLLLILLILTIRTITLLGRWCGRRRGLSTATLLLLLLILLILPLALVVLRVL